MLILPIHSTQNKANGKKDLNLHAAHSDRAGRNLGTFWAHGGHVVGISRRQAKLPREFSWFSFTAEP